ncbi:hypothetical protein CEY16_08070 [Halalkalibacillus sediminis]|uniref:Zinc ribbon domain-containing protein n=1 Tax=Halalkalibacillus sediminis TaxID=2018042 RepID=A0A2I0QU47_9BACI|nr:hypothetical protein [Halalkalibacillus sediminis]PKR77875.1 hypothetical protein CEY16_08070 [Halalkalibacillus sediminis]
MLICEKCNQVHDSGKFCGVCGGPLVESSQTPDQTQFQQEAAATSNASTAQTTNETMSQIQNGLKDYGNYFLELLKNPTASLNTNEQHFTSGMVTLFLYALTFSLSIYFLVSSLFNEYMGGFMTDTSVPFFSVNARIVFFVLLLLACAAVGIIVMLKVAQSTMNITSIFAQFGSLAAPFTAVNVLAILTGLAGSAKLTLILLGFSYSILLFVIPSLLVYDKTSTINRNGQNIYFSIGAVLITSILVYFIGDAFITEFIDNLERMVYGY